MITVDEIKEYLRIAYDDEDRLLASFIVAAYAYLRNVVDDFDLLYVQYEDFKSQADLVARFYVGELYDNREQMQGDVKLPFMCRSIITQMQLYKVKEVNENA